MYRFFFIILLTVAVSQDRIGIHQLESEKHKGQPDQLYEPVQIRTGLDIILSDSLHLLQGKSIALVTNHTGVNKDGIPNYTLLLEKPGISLKIIFSPEHGLFGEADAGEKVMYNGREVHLPTVVSLYGKTRKPTPDMLKGIDVILYDIQDIGARFYTYISTMGLVLEAAEENDIPVFILDRPNPIRNDRVEGPVLDVKFRSFVGNYPIPVQYGSTCGELALMMVGEKWVPEPPSLKVIKLNGWAPSTWVDDCIIPWVAPSPNIPNLETSIVYPGICFLEAVNINEGRGTHTPFLKLGAPWIDGKKLSQELNRDEIPGIVFSPIKYIPESIPGKSTNPRYLGEECSGVQLHIIDRNSIKAVYTGIKILSTIQELYPDKIEYNEKWFNKLWGNDDWNTFIEQPELVQKIHLTDYIEKRDQYRLY